MYFSMKERVDLNYEQLYDLAKTTFASDNCNQLHIFFQNVWNMKDYDYKVAMARRAFNLNYAFRIIDNLVSDTQVSDTWISNTALLLYHADIADYFLEHGYFPSILLLDDICLHGRSIAGVLDDLEQLIISYLDEKQTLTEEQKLSIHWDLVSVVDIFVYARNRQYLLLEKAYRDKVHAEYSLPADELRRLSLQISLFLQQSTIANTSYIISSEAPIFQLPDQGTNVWTYRGDSVRVYLRETGREIVSTLRMHLNYENDAGEEKKTRMPVSSLVIFGDMKQENFSRLCEDVAEGLAEINGISRISEILKYRHPLLQKPRAQMFCCILSLINFASYYYSLDRINEEPGQDYGKLFFDTGDLLKIISNFGRVSELKYEFSVLIQEAFSDYRVVLSDSIYDKIRDFSSSLECSYSDVSVSLEQRQEINEIAEEIFYNVGMAAEEEAYEIRLRNSIYQPSKSKGGVIPFREFLKTMREQNSINGDRFTISSVLSLMDSGLASMNMALENNTQTIGYTLKAGELATYVMPRRFYLFLPALAKVEKYHWKLELSPGKAVKQFIQTINNDAEDAQERQTLQKLKEMGDDFVDLLYRCGQSLQGWDIELLTAKERIDFASESTASEPFSIQKYLQSVIYETDRQAQYIAQADEFIRQKSV